MQEVQRPLLTPDECLRMPGPKKNAQDSQQITQGKMSYDLLRLRLHRLIERIPGTHRYQLTELGRRTALFYSRTFKSRTPPWPLSNCPSQAAPGQLQPHRRIPSSRSPANQLLRGEESRI